MDVMANNEFSLQRSMMRWLNSRLDVVEQAATGDRPNSLIKRHK